MSSKRRVMAVLDVPTVIMDPNTGQQIGMETQRKHLGFEMGQTLEDVFEGIKKYKIVAATILFENEEPEPRIPNIAGLES